MTRHAPPIRTTPYEGQNRVATERAARKAAKAARLAEIELIVERLPNRLYWLEEAGQVPGDFPSMVRRLSALVQECR